MMKKWFDRPPLCLALGMGVILATFLLLLWQSSGRSFPEAVGNSLVNEHQQQLQLTMVDNRVTGADGLIAVGAVFAHNGRSQAAETRLRLAADALGSAKAALLLAELKHRERVAPQNFTVVNFWCGRAIELNRAPANPWVQARTVSLLETIRTERDGKAKSN